MLDTSFWKDKRVLITGHTGFKGSWLTAVLSAFGANVTGFALAPSTNPSIFKLCNLEEKMNSYIGDIRDYDLLKTVFDQTKPDVLFHLAAQPIVRESYRIPRETFEVNVMGTVNVLECIRQCKSVKSAVIITTDKVYLNDGRLEGYKEEDVLNGFDPYSNSKSCADIAAQCYVNSFLKACEIPVSILRAGNVIGGGDFAKDRLIPDCVRSILSGETLQIRNPKSTRPFQHVLEPLMVYIQIASSQIYNKEIASIYNIGPKEKEVRNVSEMVYMFQAIWNGSEMGKDMPFSWECIQEENAVHEANYLKLNCDKLAQNISWQPKWSCYEAIRKTIEWTQVYINNGDLTECMLSQMQEYLTK